MLQDWSNSAQWFRRRKRDGQVDGRWMQGRIQGKITLFSQTLPMRGRHVASLVEFRQLVMEDSVTD